MIITKNGLQAAIVRDNRTKLVNLDLEADDGAQIEVSRGLKSGNQIVVSPPVNATDDMVVHVAQRTDVPARQPVDGARPGNSRSEEKPE